MRNCATRRRAAVARSRTSHERQSRRVWAEARDGTSSRQKRGEADGVTRRATSRRSFGRRPADPADRRFRSALRLRRDADDDDHEASLELLESHPGPLLVPQLVITEVAYLIETRLGWTAEVRFLGDLSSETSRRYRPPWRLDTDRGARSSISRPPPGNRRCVRHSACRKTEPRRHRHAGSTALHGCQSETRSVVCAASVIGTLLEGGRSRVESAYGCLSRCRCPVFRYFRLWT